MDNLNIYSLNVNGLRDKSKCRTVLTYIKNNLKGIIMLQETQTCTDIEDVWKEITQTACYFSHGKTDSRGVAILVTPNVDIYVSNIICDKDGRDILLETKREDSELNILNVYAPTKDKADEQIHFLDSIGTLLGNYADKQLVVAGDFNLFLNPNVDKKGGTLERDTEARTHKSFRTA